MTLRLATLTLLAPILAGLPVSAGAQTIEGLQTLTTGTYLGGAIALSPDGKNLYLAHISTQELTVFSRDPATGTLAFATEMSPVGGDDLAVAPSGSFVYLARNDTIHVFARNSETGLLTSSSTRDLDAGAGPCALALSADGAFAYAACRGANEVLLFGIDAGTGALDAPIALDDPPQGPIDLALGPDDAQLYVSSSEADSLVVYARDAGSGALTFLESHVDGENGVTGLDGADDIGVTPDGLGVYALGREGARAAIAAFERDPVSGALAFVAAAGPPSDIPGDHLAAADDAVWITGHPPGPQERALQLFAFTRDGASNALAFADQTVLIDQQTLFGPGGLVLDPLAGVIATGAYVGMFRALLVPEPGALPAFLAVASALAALRERRLRRRG